MLQKTKLSLNRKYVELASFEVNHNYYTDKKIPKIEFIPTIETAAFLRNYKLITKQQNSKIIILQEGVYEDKVWKPKIQIDKPMKTAFFLNLKDDDFQIKTNVPFFASKDKKFSIIQSNPENYVIDELQLFDFIFGSFPSQILDKEEVLKISFNGEIVFEDGTIEEFIKRFEFDTGIYEFTIANKEVIKFLWTERKSNSDGFIIFNVEQKLEQHYKAIIPNRKIFWEYILVSNYIENLTYCKIIDDQQNLQFEKIENPDSLQSNNIFTSLNTIELREKYTNNLTIEKDGEKLIKLPFPALKNLTIKKEDVKKRVNKYFLTTYVNL